MSAASWLEPLPDAADQRALDRWAIDELGIPGLQLMEQAGTGLADLVSARCPTGRIAVVCGKGNNGGDGYVAARLLRNSGREVDVLTVAPVEQLTGDAKTNMERLPGPPPIFGPRGLQGAAGVVDAILGTGTTGAPHGNAAAAIEAINAAGAAEVIACDIPSGVDASTGEVAGMAVGATATATFHAAKPGHWIWPGKSYAGEVTVVDIGIPGSGGPASPVIGLISERVAARVPRRGPASTKFAAGNVLVCGGSIGLTGAPCLASRAAARAGAGYVTACIPASLNQIFEAQLLEVMTVQLEDVDGALSAKAEGTLLERSGRAGAVVLGPGLGPTRGARELARNVSRRLRCPLVLDADGLNAHAGRLQELALRGQPTVLTPHEGELARLLRTETDAVRAQRLSSVRQAATTSGAIVVLKGDDTIVATPDGAVGVNRGGAAALATAGTGDVLSGVIAAYLAKGMDPFAAACAAVLVHAHAGRVAARHIGPEGVIASDVIDALPVALREL
jgi:NAD(P)H-hydrate epimerase